VAWLGAWPNGTEMGKSETLWQSQGGEVAAAFDAAVECSSHSLYAEIVINQPSTPPPERGIAMFEDYDFKVVTGFDSMEAFGRATDMYTGGGFMRAEELFGRLLTCNSPRIYNLERVRQAAMPPSG
jgi:hypothetical protein